MRSVTVGFATYIIVSLFLVSTVLALIIATYNEKVTPKDRRSDARDSLRLPFVWYVHKYLPPKIRLGFYLFWCALALFLAFQLIH